MVADFELKRIEYLYLKYLGSNKDLDFDILYHYLKRGLKHHYCNFDMDYIKDKILYRWDIFDIDKGNFKSRIELIKDMDIFEYNINIF